MHATSSPSRSDAQVQITPPLPVVSWIVRLLGRFRVAVDLFFVTAEGVSLDAPAIKVDGRYTAGFAGAEDIDELVRVEPGTPATMCAERLRSHFKCFAVKDGARIVAKMWCDLAECNDPGFRRPLTSREAYLFNAYTDPALRGHNLAPYMRQQCYAALRAMGRDVMFSCTVQSNTAARRFKQKLGAVEELLCANVTLFGRWSRMFVLRQYVRQPTIGRP